MARVQMQSLEACDERIRLMNELLAAFGLVAALAYFLTFLPAFFYHDDPMTLAELLPFQARMYAQQTQVLPHHTYQSDWWTWPLMIRPIWYLYEHADGAMRGVLMIGNPAVLWGGLIAVLACLWAGLRNGRVMTAGLLWVAAYLPWVIIPKSLGFFYYYYVPSIALPIAAPRSVLNFMLALSLWRSNRAARSRFLRKIASCE